MWFTHLHTGKALIDMKEKDCLHSEQIDTACWQEILTPSYQVVLLLETFEYSFITW